MNARARRAAAALLFLLPLVACDPASDPTGPAASDTAQARDAAALPGQPTGLAGASSYIVVFRPGVANSPGLARQLVRAHGGELGLTYETALQGFQARLPGAALAGIRNHPSVAYVEADGPVEAWGSGSGAAASWGLDRASGEGRAAR